MVPFEELQDLWRSQPTALAERPAVRVAELTEAFRGYGRRQNYINMARLGLVVLQVVLWARMQEPHTPSMFGAIALVLLGELVYLFSDWRNQLGIAGSNFSEPSLEFVRTTLQRLYDQRNPVRRHYWLLITTLAGGLNLLGLAKDEHLTWWQRIAYHLTLCAAPFAAIALGLAIRGKRWRYECLPLVERLRAIERELEEGGI